jgi:hypothetical protein
MMKAVARRDQTYAHSHGCASEESHPREQESFSLNAHLQILGKCGYQGLEISP